MFSKTQLKDMRITTKKFHQKKEKAKTSAKVDEKAEQEKLRTEKINTKFNELELISEWRKKLRIIKSNDFEEDAEILVKNFNILSTKYLYDIEKEFERYSKDSCADLNFESEYADTIKSMANTHIGWTAELDSMIGERFNNIAINHETNLVSMKKYYKDVIKSLQNQIDDLQTQFDINAIAQISQQHQTLKETKNQLQLQLNEDKLEIAMIQNRIQNVLQSHEVNTFDLHNDYQSYMKKTKHNNKVINQKRKEIKLLEEELSKLEFRLMIYETDLDDTTTKAAFMKGNIFEMRRNVYNGLLNREKQMKKVVYNNYLKSKK